MDSQIIPPLAFNNTQTHTQSKDANLCMQYTETCTFNVLLRTNTGGGGTALSGYQLSWHTFHIYKGGKKTFKFQCLHPPLPSFPLPSSLSPSPFPSSWLLQWWTAQQWKPGYVNIGGIQHDSNTVHCASAPKAGEQREISIRSVLSGGVNKINSISYPLLCLRHKYTTIKANKWHRWDKKMPWMQTGSSHICSRRANFLI